MWWLQMVEKSAAVTFWRCGTIVPQASISVTSLPWSKMEGCSGGAGGRGAEQGWCAAQGWCYSIVLTSWVCLSDPCKALDLGEGKSVKPPHISAVVFSSWLQAALFLHHHFGAVCAGTACVFQSTASLCEPTTRDECLAWSCILAGFGAHGYCFCTCYCCYVYEFSRGEQRWGKCRRRNELGFPLAVSM